MITVTAARMVHILHGDATGGGHRHGSRDPTKTKFPQSWDDARIRTELLSVANDPTSVLSVQPNGKLRLEGVRGGIRIRVIVHPTTSEIVTAHPF